MSRFTTVLAVPSSVLYTLFCVVAFGIVCSGCGRYGFSFGADKPATTLDGGSNGEGGIGAGSSDGAVSDGSTDGSALDAQVDGATDAGTDGATDGGLDAATDGATDAAVDGGTMADGGVDGGSVDGGSMDGGADGGSDSGSMSDGGTDGGSDAGDGGMGDAGADAGADGGSMPMACEDLNCDGLPDLLVVQEIEGANVTSDDREVDSYVYYNQAGSFDDVNREGIAGRGPITAATGDINEDGFQDVVLASFSKHYFSNAVNYVSQTRVYWGSAVGFTGPTTLSTRGVRNVVVDDIDGDGHLDIVFAEWRDDVSLNCDWAIEVMLVWGDGTNALSCDRSAPDPSECHLFPNQQGTWDVKVRDFDKDGNKDVLFSENRSCASNSQTNRNAFVYWGKAGKAFESSRSMVTIHGGREIHVFDANGDGFDDFLLPSYQTDESNFASTSYVYLQDPMAGFQSGRFSNSSRVGISSVGAVQAAVGLVDNDANPDVVLFGYNQGGGSWGSTPSYVYDGAAFSSSTQITGMGIADAGIRYGELHDLDSDGNLDLVTARSTVDGSDYEIDSLIYWGSTTGFSPTSTTGLPTLGANHVAVGDLNQDGCPEIVYGNIRDNNNASSWDGSDTYIYYGDPMDCRNGYSISNRTVLDTSKSPKVLIVGDATW